MCCTCFELFRFLPNRQESRFEWRFVINLTFDIVKSLQVLHPGLNSMRRYLELDPAVHYRLGAYEVPHIYL